MYEFNSIRNALHRLVDENDRKQQIRGVEDCDRRLFAAHKKSVEFITKWIEDYFKRTHQFAKPRPDVTTTVRYFVDMDSKNCIAKVIDSRGPRAVEQEINVAEEASLAAYKATSGDGEERPTIGAYICNDLINWALRSRFFHPSLHERGHNSLALLQDAYEARSRYFGLLPRKEHKRLNSRVLGQWEACWLRGEQMISSMAVFPITLANNTVSPILKNALTRDGQNFDENEVFGVISLESPAPHTFNVGDVLMGRIWADAMFTLTGAITHYHEMSSLRRKFDELP